MGMMRLGAALALGLAAGGTAQAAGVERSAQSVAILFEQGNYAELTFGHVAPRVTGVQTVPAGPVSPGGASSGDVAVDFTTLAMAVKLAVNDRLDLAFVIDEPIGADVAYPLTGYLESGSRASLDSVALTALARYRMTESVSVIAGLRALRSSGDVALFTGYRLTTDSPVDLGAVLGLAWERPEIAARLALTWNGPIHHDFAARENGIPTSFRAEIPQSLHLEAQTGLAADLLLFGSVRWVEWSRFVIAPPGFVATPANLFGRPLVAYGGDVATYSLGLGRKLSEAWSVSASLTHEDRIGGYAGSLGPADGFTSLDLGVVHSRAGLRLSAGLRYALLGDAVTQTPAALGVLLGTCGAGDTDCGAFGQFRDNRALALGLKVGFSF